MGTNAAMYSLDPRLTTKLIDRKYSIPSLNLYTQLSTTQLNPSALAVTCR